MMPLKFFIGAPSSPFSAGTPVIRGKPQTHDPNRYKMFIVRLCIENRGLHGGVFVYKSHKTKEGCDSQSAWTLAQEMEQGQKIKSAIFRFSFS